MKRFIHVRSILVLLSAVVLCVSVGRRCTAEEGVDNLDRRNPRFVQATGEGKKLYVIPDEGDGDEQSEVEVNVDIFDNADDFADFKDRRSKTDYPTLYRPGHAEGVIVVIGFDGCVWCKKQLKEFPDGHRVLYVDKDKSDKPDGPSWNKLIERFNLFKTYPTTLIIEKGKLTKSFSGFKPWAAIEPHATNTKEQDDKPEPQPEPTIRKRFFDFFFPKPKPTPISRGGGGRRGPVVDGRGTNPRRYLEATPGRSGDFPISSGVHDSPDATTQGGENRQEDLREIEAGGMVGNALCTGPRVPKTRFGWNIYLPSSGRNKRKKYGNRTIHRPN